MYQSDRASTSPATMAAAAFLFIWTILAPDARAEPASTGADDGSIIAAPRWQTGPSQIGPSQLPGLPAMPEPGDQRATLDAIDIALTQAGDGSTYVWRRGNGRLLGAVRPTKTFRDADRRMCRHIEVQLQLGAQVRRTEGIACRGADGVWDLEG